MLGHLDNLESYGRLDHFIQYCLLGWPVIVTWICDPEISERYFFWGQFVSKIPLQKKKMGQKMDEKNDGIRGGGTPNGNVDA